MDSDDDIVLNEMTDHVNVDVDEDGEDDEDAKEEDELMDEVLYGKEKKGVIPSEEDKATFIRQTKMSPEFGKDEWRKQK